MMPYSEHGTNTRKSLESSKDAISPQGTTYPAASVLLCTANTQ